MLEEDQYKDTVVWGPKGDSFIVKVLANLLRPVRYTSDLLAFLVAFISAAGYERVHKDSPAAAL